MRKVGKPKLCGHPTRTRPPSASRYQAIKVPIAALRQAGPTGRTDPGPALSDCKFGCGKGARAAALGVPQRPAQAQITPDFAALRGSAARPIKAAPIARQYSDRVRWNAPATLAMAQALASRRLLPMDAKSTLPTNYTEYDFVLIRLHQRHGTDDIAFSNHSRTSWAQHRCSVATTGEMTMNTSLNHGSAKIYQFPAGGRAALGGRRYDEPNPQPRRRRASAKRPAAAAGITKRPFRSPSRMGALMPMHAATQISEAV